MTRFAEVAVALPVDRTFHYSIPDALKEKASIGKRVWVPFGPGRIVGYIVGFSESSDIANIKDIQEVIDESPVLDEAMLKLTKWISGYYFCSWGEAIENALPATLRQGKTKLTQRSPAPERVYEQSFHMKLTYQQKKALDPVLEDMHGSRHNVYLLFGITGSGKISSQNIPKALLGDLVHNAENFFVV